MLLGEKQIVAFRAQLGVQLECELIAGLGDGAHL